MPFSVFENQITKAFHKINKNNIILETFFIISNFSPNEQSKLEIVPRSSSYIINIEWVMCLVS